MLSQRLLQTREVILMQHTDCGLEGADETGLRAQIAAEMGREPPYRFGAFAGGDADRQARAARDPHPSVSCRTAIAFAVSSTT